jgi:hypothetical protein
MTHACSPKTITNALVSISGHFLSLHTGNTEKWDEKDTGMPHLATDKRYKA